MQGNSDRGVLSLPEARLKPLAPCQDLPGLSHPWLPACFFLLAETTIIHVKSQSLPPSRLFQVAQAAQVKTDLNNLSLHAASKNKNKNTFPGCPVACRVRVPCTLYLQFPCAASCLHVCICNATSLIIAGPGVLAVANGEICPSICMRAQIIAKGFPGLAACVRIHNERSAGGSPQHRQHGIVPTRWTPRGIVSLIGMRKSLTLGTYIDDPEMVPSHMGTDPLVTSDAEQATNETRNAVLLGGRAKAQLDISSRVESRSFSLSDTSELLARRFQMSPNRQPPVSPITMFLATIFLSIDR